MIPSHMEIISETNLLLLTNLVTAGWLVRNWLRRREDYPKIDLNCGVKLIHRDTTHSLVEVWCEIVNTGSVRHKYRKLTYSLRGHEGTGLQSAGETGIGEMEFPVVIRERQRFFPHTWVYSFADAGVTSRHRQVIVIPNKAKVLSLRCRMGYDDLESDFHTASWVGVL